MVAGDCCDKLFTWFSSQINRLDFILAIFPCFPDPSRLPDARKFNWNSQEVIVSLTRTYSEEIISKKMKNWDFPKDYFQRLIRGLPYKMFKKTVNLHILDSIISIKFERKWNNGRISAVKKVYIRKYFPIKLFLPLIISSAGFSSVLFRSTLSLCFCPKISEPRKLSQFNLYWVVQICLIMIVPITLENHLISANFSGAFSEMEKLRIYLNTAIITIIVKVLILIRRKFSVPKPFRKDPTSNGKYSSFQNTGIFHLTDIFLPLNKVEKRKIEIKFKRPYILIYCTDIHHLCVEVVGGWMGWKRNCEWK